MSTFSEYDQFFARAVARARKGQCSRAGGLIALNLATGNAMPLGCKNWGCKHCGHVKKLACLEVIMGGAQRQMAAGQTVRFITLTAPRAGMDLKALYTSWNRLKAALRKKRELAEYAMTVEMQKRGALHVHCVCTGSYIPQRRLSELAGRAGFGTVCDIRALSEASVAKVAGYTVKDMAHRPAEAVAGYMTKSPMGAFAAAAAGAGMRSARPMRCSRGWYPGGLDAAQQAVFGRPTPGTWILLAKTKNGGRPLKTLGEAEELALLALLRPQQPQPSAARPSVLVYDQPRLPVLADALTSNELYAFLDTGLLPKRDLKIPLLQGT